MLVVVFQIPLALFPAVLSSSMPKLTLKKSADALNMGKIERGPELSAGTQPILMWQELQE